MVGMAEIKVARADDPAGIGAPPLMALGLGSCIGVCAYDRQVGVAGMAHVVLPENTEPGGEAPGKFANTAIPVLISEMVRLGASAHRIRAAIVGGAQLFSFEGGSSRLAIGSRNTESVLQALRSNHIRLVAQDVGGRIGRTVQLFPADGRVRVKTIGHGECDLVLLGEPEPISM